jgi:hypothetical protein
VYSSVHSSLLIYPLGLCIPKATVSAVLTNTQEEVTYKVPMVYCRPDFVDFSHLRVAEVRQTADRKVLLQTFNLRARSGVQVKSVRAPETRTKRVRT